MRMYNQLIVMPHIIYGSTLMLKLHCSHLYMPIWSAKLAVDYKQNMAINVYFHVIITLYEQQSGAWQACPSSSHSQDMLIIGLR